MQVRHEAESYDVVFEGDPKCLSSAIIKGHSETGPVCFKGWGVTIARDYYIYMLGGVRIHTEVRR